MSREMITPVSQVFVFFAQTFANDFKTFLNIAAENCLIAITATHACTRTLVCAVNEDLISLSNKAGRWNAPSKLTLNQPLRHPLVSELHLHAFRLVFRPINYSIFTLEAC